MNKKNFGYVVLLGSAWGLAECALGAGLKACASSISGSVMTAVALFFIAAAWVAGQGTSVRLEARPGFISTGKFDGSGSTPPCLKSSGASEGSGSSGEAQGSCRLESSGTSEGSGSSGEAQGPCRREIQDETRGLGGGLKVANVALLVAVAILFKMFDALLLGVPLWSGAVTHPVFAFVLEGAGFLAVGALLIRSRKHSQMKSSPARGILWGGASALIAAAAFPLVKFASGIPACVVPGSPMPMAWAYAPLAIGLSMLTVPLGFKMVEKVRFFFVSSPAWRIPAAVLLSLALMTVIRWGSGLNF